VYDGTSFVENSPRPLSDYGLPTTLDKIDAVQVWGRNGEVPRFVVIRANWIF
jgi:hypothetical protein